MKLLIATLLFAMAMTAEAQKTDTVRQYDGKYFYKRIRTFYHNDSLNQVWITSSSGKYNEVTKTYSKYDEFGRTMVSTDSTWTCRFRKLPNGKLTPLPIHLSSTTVRIPSRHLTGEDRTLYYDSRQRVNDDRITIWKEDELHVFTRKLKDRVWEYAHMVDGNPPYWFDSDVQEFYQASKQFEHYLKLSLMTLKDFTK